MAGKQNPTKKQHYVPCCYLQFFAEAGSWEKGRNTKIFFTDGKKSLSVPVKELAREDHAYSKDFPEFDKEFEAMETSYPPIIRKIMNNQVLTRLEYYGLMMTMVDLNLRNIAYEKRTKAERRVVYEAISRSMNADMFAEARGAGTDNRGILEWVVKHWRVQPLMPETEEKFITSDNPSAIYGEARTGRPVLVYLPVHPKYAVIAFDNRFLRVTSNLVTDDALGVLNGLQVNHCVKHVFSDHDLLEGDERHKLIGLLNKEKPLRYVDDNEWRRSFMSIASPAFDRFTFLKKIRPINATLQKAIRKVLNQRSRRPN